MEANDYQSRLKVTEDWFHTLPCEDKLETLKSLVDTCDQLTVQALFEHWQAGMKCDFLPLLPEEIFEKVVNSLAVADICRCLQVSAVWRMKMRHSAMWKHKCLKAGLAVEDSSEQEFQGEDETDYMWWFTHHEKVKSLFDEMYVLPLVGHSDKVISLAYCQGKVATGAEDYSVKIWDGATATCLATIETSKPYNYIKFDSDRLVAAELDYQSLKWLHVKHCSWELSDFKPIGKMSEYPSHEGEIFCIDYNVDYDLVVAVSDTTATISKLSTGREQTSLEVQYDRIEHLPDQVLLCMDTTRKPSEDYYYYVIVRDPCSFLVYKMRYVRGAHKEVAEYYVSDNETTQDHMENYGSMKQTTFRFHRMKFIDTSGMHLVGDCLWFAGRQAEHLVGGMRQLDFSPASGVQSFKPEARSVTFGKLRYQVLDKNWHKYYIMGNKRWPRCHYLGAGRAYHVMLDLGDPLNVPRLDVYAVPEDPAAETCLVYTFEWPIYFSRVPTFRFGERGWLDGNTAKVGVCLMASGERTNSAGVLLQRSAGDCRSPRVTDYVHVHRQEDEADGSGSEDYYRLGFGFGHGYGYDRDDDDEDDDEDVEEEDEEEEEDEDDGDEDEDFKEVDKKSWSFAAAKVKQGAKTKGENKKGDDEWETDEEEDFS